MTAPDFEAEYNNRARVPEHPAIMAGWKADAAAYRASHSYSEIGLRYGSTSRQMVDLFWPDGTRDAPIALFIHGGYWQALDPSHFSHLASAANANGIALAIPGYDLCPQVSVADIIDQVRAATLYLWQRHQRPMVASGHSAGGHLTACLVATDWKALDVEAPADLVPAGLSISGLFELEPLVPTSINNALKLDANEARRLSPLDWPVAKGLTLDAWVGGAESSEYLRQSRAIADAWNAKGVKTAYCEIEGANHFTVLSPFADSASEIAQRLAALARALRQQA
jgi:arylformamidase